METQVMTTVAEVCSSAFRRCKALVRKGSQVSLHPKGPQGPKEFLKTFLIKLNSIGKIFKRDYLQNPSKFTMVKLDFEEYDTL